MTASLSKLVNKTNRYMKVFVLMSVYYDYAEEWESIQGIYSTNEKALEVQIELEGKNTLDRQSWIVREEVVL